MRHVVSWRWIQLLRRKLVLRFTATTSLKRKTVSDYVAALKQCGKTRDLENGKTLHQEVQKNGLLSIAIVANALVSMYSRCRCMNLALVVSEKMPHKDVVTWNTLIQGYVEQGESVHALCLFKYMDCEPNHVTFLAALKACTGLAGVKNSEKAVALEKGIAIHKRAKALALDSNVFVASSLVDMYSKCGDMTGAQKTFDTIPNRNVVVWNCLLMGYVLNSGSSKTVELFNRMDCEANHVTYLAVLKALVSSASESPSAKPSLLSKGMVVHEQMKRHGLDSNLAVANTLVDMYSKLGNIHLAREAFNRMIQKDVVTWNCMISGYVQNQESSSALELFNRMSCRPDRFTFIATLKACSGLSSSDRQTALREGMKIHEEVKKLQFESDIFIASTLVDMYGKLNQMVLAKEVFDQMDERNVVTWNSLMLGYIDSGEGKKALELFENMDCEPDHLSFVAALKACGSIASQRGDSAERQGVLEKGLAVHKMVEERGLVSNTVVAVALMEMYSQCGDMKSSQSLFERMKHKDVVAWTSVILGYVENGEGLLALKYFDIMDCPPDPVSFVAALKACGSLGRSEDATSGLQNGLVLHERIKRLSYDSKTVVANALLDMYGKCGSMRKAREVFDGMATKDVISWNTVVGGYVENGEGFIALELFDGMDVEPNQVTYAAALKACTSLRTLDKGMSIHRQLKHQFLDTTLFVSNTLIDMYSKCGRLPLAREVFNEINDRDVVSWNCLMLGYVENGESLQALQLYTSMDCRPNHVTFLAALKACAALAIERWSERDLYLEKGIKIHEHVKEHGFETDTIVTGSLVDMYSKCGNMNLASELFSRMPVKDVVTWTSIILGYVENKESSAALELFGGMDCEPNQVTYFAALKACGSLADLPLGRYIHSKVCRLGLEGDTLIATGLVHFYGRSGCMTAALAVFDGMQSPEIAAWTGLIAGYGSTGETHQVFDLVERIKEAGVELSASAFAGILTACSHAGMLEEGERWFEYMERNGVRAAVDHYTCLVDMFGRANMLDEAVELVKRMPFRPDEVTWTVILDACKKWRNAEVGKAAFDALLQSGGKKDSATPYVTMADIYTASKTIP